MMMLMGVLAVSSLESILAAPVAPAFIQVTGNACATGQNGAGPSPCGCEGQCKDKPGFTYKGEMGNSTACAATCMEGSGCDIWLWSEGSKHCWWRTDRYWAPSPAGGGDLRLP